jgi:hypothetical protein
MWKKEKIPPIPQKEEKKPKQKQNHRDFTLKEKLNFNICFIQTAIVQPINQTMYYVFYSLSAKNP